MTDSTTTTTLAVCPARRAAARRDAPGRARGSQDRRLQLRRHAATRSRTAARTTTGRSPRASSTPPTCTVECPRHGSLFDLSHRQAEDPPRLCSGADVRDDRRGRHHRSGGRLTMATPEVSRREKRARRNQRRLQGEVRLPRPRVRLRLQGAEGPLARGRRIDLRVQGRAAVDARLPAQGAGALLLAPDPDLGRQPRPDRLRRHPLLRPRLRKEQPRLERGPRGHQEHLRPARHPRGGAQIPLRGRRPVRVRGRLPPGQREARGPGRDLHRHGHRAARARGPGARVLGDDHPAQRQQAGGAQLAPSGRAAPSSTCPPGSRSRCRCRPTSGSTPRTWASSSAR